MNNSEIENSRIELSPDKVIEVHRNPWFNVKNRDDYYTLEYDNPQTVVLPVIDDMYIVLLRSYRPIINDTPWELPAGGSENGEGVVEAVRRELSEEAGIYVSDLDRFELLPPIAEMPGRMPELLSIFKVELTMQEYESRNGFDQEEVLETGIFSFREVAEMIRDNKIYLSAVSCILSRYLFSKISLSVFE